jgi:hypothetical protein
MTLRARLERLQVRMPDRREEGEDALEKLFNRLKSIRERLAHGRAPENPSFAEILCGAPCTQARCAARLHRPP